jgi:hypothetical protein
VSGRRILAAIAAALALGTAPAVAQSQDQGAQSQDQGVIYQRYANVRERLLACELEAVWDTLTPANARRCRRMKRLYLLYAWPGNASYYHVLCRTRRCMPTPYGEPPADGALPEGSSVYR